MRVEYYSKGKKRSEQPNYVLGGCYKYWTEKGTQTHEVHWKNNIRIGLCKWWNSNGSIDDQKNYNKGLEHGIKIHFRY